MRWGCDHGVAKSAISLSEMSMKHYLNITQNYQHRRMLFERHELGCDTRESDSKRAHPTSTIFE